MDFNFEYRPSDSPYVEMVWHTQSGELAEGEDSFISKAEYHWEMVITKQHDNLTLSIRGPETLASPAPIPDHAEFFGIVFKIGTFMSHLPAKELVNNAIHLPEAARRAFYLQGSVWEFPNFENADTFLDRLTRMGMLSYEPLVEEVLQDQSPDLSARSIQRRFMHATGLTPTTIRQIQRAQQAVQLLEQGTPILDTIFEAGYFDQPHLTRSLKRFVGLTPTQVLPMPPTK